MTKRMLCIAVALSAAACAKGGGASAPVVETFKLCRAPAPKAPVSPSTTSGNLEAFSSDSNDDKVLFENTQLGSPKALGVASGREAELAAGTTISVTLREACENPGVIASALLGNQQLPASPSGVRSLTWKLDEPLKLSDLKAAAAADACVVSVNDSVVAKASALPSDPMNSIQNHLAALEMEAGLTYVRPQLATAPVTIAIIDTGADLNHEDLRNNLWTNEAEIPGNKVDDDNNGYVDDVHGYNFALDDGNPEHSGKWAGYQHGTHVAGLAAAQSGNGRGGMGVASGAKIMVLNVFGKDAGAFSSDIANAIRYAADNGADIINLSVGGLGRSAVYLTALEYAIQKGATAFAAAGNERHEMNDSYFMSPAGYAADLPGMIAVASVDSRDLGLSVFSNFGAEYVELSAPGAESSRDRVGLLSTFPGDIYARLQGTSMASPVAAAAGAFAIEMMRERGYSPSPATVEALLEASAKKSVELREKVRGGRVVNIKNLAEFIDKTYPQRQEGANADPGVPGFNPCEY